MHFERKVEPAYCTAVHIQKKHKERMLKYTPQQMVKERVGFGMEVRYVLQKKYWTSCQRILLCTNANAFFPLIKHSGHESKTFKMTTNDMVPAGLSHERRGL
jgi:hypothetical protein